MVGAVVEGRAIIETPGNDKGVGAGCRMRKADTPIRGRPGANPVQASILRRAAQVRQDGGLAWYGSFRGAMKGWHGWTR